MSVHYRDIDNLKNQLFTMFEDKEQFGVERKDYNLTKVVYVSGPYTNNDTHENIMRAKRAAISLWNQGYAVLCPHLNTYHFENESKFRLNYVQILSGDLLLLHKCDYIYLMDNWRNSHGAIIEAIVALMTNTGFIGHNGPKSVLEFLYYNKYITDKEHKKITELLSMERDYPYYIPLDVNEKEE